MFSKKTKRTAALALMITLSAALPCQAFAAQKTAEARSLSIMSMTNLSGTEIASGTTVNKGGKKDIKGSKGMKLGNGYTVSTDGETQAYIAADSDKVIKMDAGSEITIGKASEKKLSVSLNYGEMVFGVENKLHEGSSLTFNVGGTAMSIRGTVGGLKADSNGAQLSLFSGNAVIACSNGETLVISQGEMIDVNADGNVSVTDITIENLSPFAQLTLTEALDSPISRGSFADEILDLLPDADERVGLQRNFLTEKQQKLDNEFKLKIEETADVDNGISNISHVAIGGSAAGEGQSGSASGGGFGSYRSYEPNQGQP